MQHTGNGGLDAALERLLRASVAALGYDLIGIERCAKGAQAVVLRLYIDHERGITIDDCAQVSDQVSGVLDVEDPARARYLLEVSSPGLDRPLFRKQDFDRFCGCKIHVVMHPETVGRRKYTGTLRGRNDDMITMLVDEKEYQLPLRDICSARLVPEF